jgi:uncharacterized protein with HEPN domain
VTDDRTRERLSLTIEHLQTSIEYSRRGRKVFFDADNPDTMRLVESELRKAYESLNRLGDSFYNSNPKMPRERIGEARQALTDDYADVDPAELWRLVPAEAPDLLRQLTRIRVPRHS